MPVKEASFAVQLEHRLLESVRNGGNGKQALTVHSF